ncbi:MAG: hypothetical protein NUV65_05740 [Candidatus Roizmanbacteria bacterium]|nr:hypothetical protein [Candidatus Roizmanbacteria bacterium]
MPTSSEDIAKIEALRKKTSEANKTAGTLGAGSKTFADKVMGRVRDARAQRGTSQLATDIGTTTGQITSAPADMRARMANVNPLTTDAMTARQTAQTQGTLATQANVEASRTGTIEDILGAGSNRLLAMAEQKEAEANAAKQEADSLMEAIKLRMAEEQHKLDMALKNKSLNDTGQVTKDEQEAAAKAFTDEYVNVGLELEFGDATESRDFQDDVLGTADMIRRGEISPENGAALLRMSWKDKLPQLDTATDPSQPTEPTLVNRISQWLQKKSDRSPKITGNPKLYSTGNSLLP